MLPTHVFGLNPPMRGNVFVSILHQMEIPQIEMMPNVSGQIQFMEMRHLIYQVFLRSFAIRTILAQHIYMMSLAMADIYLPRIKGNSPTIQLRRAFHSSLQLINADTKQKIHTHSSATAARYKPAAPPLVISPHGAHPNNPPTSPPVTKSVIVSELPKPT